MLVSEMRSDDKFSAPRGHPLSISEGAEVCMGQNFKLLLEGCGLQQSCRVGRGDNKYEKILSEGLATTESRGVKISNSVPMSLSKEK